MVFLIYFLSNSNVFKLVFTGIIMKKSRLNIVLIALLFLLFILSFSPLLSASVKNITVSNASRLLYVALDHYDKLGNIASSSYNFDWLGVNAYPGSMVVWDVPSRTDWQFLFASSGSYSNFINFLNLTQNKYYWAKESDAYWSNVVYINSTSQNINFDRALLREGFSIVCKEGSTPQNMPAGNFNDCRFGGYKLV